MSETSKKCTWYHQKRAEPLRQAGTRMRVLLALGLARGGAHDARHTGSRTNRSLGLVEMYKISSGTSAWNLEKARLVPPEPRKAAWFGPYTYTRSARAWSRAWGRTGKRGFRSHGSLDLTEIYKMSSWTCV